MKFGIYVSFIAFCAISALLGYPSQALAQSETLFPDQSTVCNDFRLDYNAVDQNDLRYYLTPQPFPTPTTAETTNETHDQGIFDFSGWLRLDGGGFPDFSTMKGSLEQWLSLELTNEQKDKLKIDEKSLRSVILHYVNGVDDKGNLIAATAFPKTEYTQPGWFTGLVSLSRIICGLMQKCPSAPLEVTVQQPALTTIENRINPKTYCARGMAVPEEPLQGVTTVNDAFGTQSYGDRVTKVTTTTTSDYINIGTRREETGTLYAKTRGALVGGKDFNNQMAFFDGLLSPDVVKKGNFPLTTSGIYSVSQGYTMTNADALNWQRLVAIRRFCLFQCSQMPQGVDVNKVYNFCPSCDPDDYKIIDTPLSQYLCQRDPATNACDYYDPGDYARCDGDPFCESGRCNPYEWGLAPDYLDRGCPLPYSGNDCTDPTLCEVMEFEPNSGGGFGACQYKNNKVCVRTDREDTGMCAAVCNWACCAYQK